MSRGRGPDPRVAVLSRMTAKAGKEEALKALILDFYAEVSASEPGCLMNMMHQGVDQTPSPSPGMFSFVASGHRRFIFYEVYADQEAAQRHPTTPHFAKMIARLAELIDGPIEVEFVDRIGGLEATGRIEAKTEPGFVLRTFRPGDVGLIAGHQSAFYRAHHGWNSNIEVNAGEVTAAFLRNFKPGREQCWVAEVGGDFAGSIFLTDEGGGLSRLRLLYVAPHFQGRGIGDALVSACIEFARSVGYARITLWTHSILESARRIYARHGFRIVATQEHDTFGPLLMGETWELRL